jgi:low affinity Fe/Cu permease
MRRIYKHSEKSFERIATLAMAVPGNSVTFILALILVFFWISNEQFYKQDIHYRVGDIILGITFLSLFIIQKSFNRFSAALHLKVNELVSSHAPANNNVIHAELKPESELQERSKEYAESVQTNQK